MLQASPHTWMLYFGTQFQMSGVPSRASGGRPTLAAAFLPAGSPAPASPPASAPHFQFSHCTKRLFKHEPAVPHRRSGVHARRAGHVELAGSERRRNETRETKYDGVLTMCLISWLEMNGAIVRGQRFPEKVSFKYWSVVSLLVKMNFIAPK